MKRTSTRSLNLTSQALSLILAGMLIHSVWRTTGTRVAIVAEVALGVALITNLVWSGAVTGRVSISVVDVATDAVVGDEVSCTIDVRGATTPVAVRMISSPHARSFRVTPPDQGALEAIAGSRGVATAAVFEIASTAPLGLVGLNRRVVVDLPHPLHVGPRPTPVPDARIPERRIRSSAEEDVRGTRPWTPSDPMRRVHWPTVARTGTLAVRDYEPPPTPTIRLVIDLGDGGAPGEAAAARAAWVANEALRRGHRVVLSSVERRGPVAGLVRSPIDVSRRLASVTRGTPSVPVAEHGDAVVVISPRGDQWQA